MAERRESPSFINEYNLLIEALPNYGITQEQFDTYLNEMIDRIQYIVDDQGRIPSYSYLMDVYHLRILNNEDGTYIQVGTTFEVLEGKKDDLVANKGWIYFPFKGDCEFNLASQEMYTNITWHHIRA